MTTSISYKNYKLILFNYKIKYFFNYNNNHIIFTNIIDTNIIDNDFYNIYQFKDKRIKKNYIVFLISIDNELNIENFNNIINNFYEFYKNNKFKLNIFLKLYLIIAFYNIDISLIYKYKEFLNNKFKNIIIILLNDKINNNTFDNIDYDTILLNSYMTKNLNDFIILE